MFINKSSKEINLKLIYVGPQSCGKDANLQYIYAHTAPDSKGKLVSLSTATENTLFFDILPRGLGEIQGYRVRLHLYALAGPEHYAASTVLLLKNADGIVFVADTRRARIEADIEALERVKQAIHDQGRDWSELPKVFQLNTHDAGEALPAAEVKRALGLESDLSIVADSRDGTGVFDTLKAGVRELLRGLKDRRVKEWVPTPEERASGDQMTSRVQLVSHYADFFGEGTHEFGPWLPAPRAAHFYMMFHPPTKKRPFVTYATFGLSTERQPPGGPEPRIELLAYTQAENERAAERLHTIATMIASASSTDTPFKTYDTVDIGDLTLPDARFALVPPDEVGAFTHFPDQKRKLEQLLFTEAVGEATDADARVTFLKLLPLTADEAEFAAEHGTRELLKKFSGKPRYFGWGRGPEESVLGGAHSQVK